jgi:hypothetical protein
MLAEDNLKLGGGPHLLNGQIGGQVFGGRRMDAAFGKCQ